MRFSLAQQRYNRRAMVLMTAYGICLLAAVALFTRAHPTGAVAYAAAILPALPLVANFVAFIGYLSDEADEYLRMLQVRQSLIATGLTLCASTVWGFLEGFGLAPHLDAWWWPVVWVVGLGIGGGANVLIERRAR